MAVAGLYRRVLPCPPAIEFSSDEGKAIFREALENGTMEGFFQLIAHFQTQAEPAFCGLASLAVVLNALAIDPGRTWKGIWRWYDESMLECCESLEKVKAEGITFGKVACAGQCAGASVKAVRANKSSLTEFRNRLIECTSSARNHMIVSYGRQTFAQTGAGHFSPVGGYHSGKDLALILDVARFKYPPHWVPVPLLWDAVNTLDPATGNWRGFLLASKPERPPSVLFTLVRVLPFLSFLSSCKDELWRPISKFLVETVPHLLRSTNIQTQEQALHVVLCRMPGDVTSLLKWIAEVKRAEIGANGLNTEAALALDSKVKVLSQLRQVTLHHLISEWSNRLCRECPQSCPMPCQPENCLPQIVHDACYQGAAALSGVRGSSDRGLKDGSISTSISDRSKTTVVKGNVALADGTQNRVDVLVPTVPAAKGSPTAGQKCLPSHPAAADLLTMLVFALPPAMWGDLSGTEVRQEMTDAVSTTHLPRLLRTEVENLREQLYLVHKWCGNGEIEGDFGSPELVASQLSSLQVS